MTRHAKKNKKPMVISWRFAFVVLSLSTIFVGLVARAAYIQVIEPDMLVEQGDLRSLRVKSDEVMRGMIFDRNGEELAVSVPVESIYADSKIVMQAKANADSRRWYALADMLQMTPEALTKKIAPDPKKRYVYLERHASPPTVD